MTIIGQFSFVAETTNTVRYTEVAPDGLEIGPGAPIRPIYLSKRALPKPFPQSLTVTVEV